MCIISWLCFTESTLNIPSPQPPLNIFSTATLKYEIVWGTTCYSPDQNSALLLRVQATSCLQVLVHKLCLPLFWEPSSNPNTMLCSLRLGQPQVPTCSGWVSRFLRCTFNCTHAHSTHSTHSSAGVSSSLPHVVADAAPAWRASPCTPFPPHQLVLTCQSRLSDLGKEGRGFLRTVRCIMPLGGPSFLVDACQASQHGCTRRPSSRLALLLCTQWSRLSGPSPLLPPSDAWQGACAHGPAGSNAGAQASPCDCKDATRGTHQEQPGSPAYLLRRRAAAHVLSLIAALSVLHQASLRDVDLHVQLQ